MTSPTRGVLHVARASVLGVVAVALAVGAHVVGGGAAPGALAALVLAALTSAVVLVQTTRRLGTGGVLASLGALQVVLHAAMTLLTPHSSHPITVIPVSHHRAVVLGDLGGAHGHGASLAMTAAHVVATVLTALLLARAEGLVWLLAALVVPVVTREVRLAVTHAPAAPADVNPLALARQWWVRLTPRRGPPVLV